jgi:hypothetical protein
MRAPSTSTGKEDDAAPSAATPSRPPTTNENRTLEVTSLDNNHTMENEAIMNTPKPPLVIFEVAGSKSARNRLETDLRRRSERGSDALIAPDGFFKRSNVAEDRSVLTAKVRTPATDGVDELLRRHRSLSGHAILIAAEDQRLSAHFAGGVRDRAWSPMKMERGALVLTLVGPTATLDRCEAEMTDTKSERPLNTLYKLEINRERNCDALHLAYRYVGGVEGAALMASALSAQYPDLIVIASAIPDEDGPTFDNMWLKGGARC